MASPSTNETQAPDSGSAAERLLQQHSDVPHNVTLEDAEDEDLRPPQDSTSGEAPSWTPTMTSKAAGKQKEAPVATSKLDMQSHDAFPELGPPKSKADPSNVPQWGSRASGAKTNGTSSTNGASRAGTPASGHAGASQSNAPSISIPGRNVEHVVLENSHILPRAQLRRPIPDIVKDLNKKSRAKITGPINNDRRIRFEAVGPQDAAQAVLRELVNEIGTKQQIKVPIPQSARAHIIGKQGATIKSLQEKSGARIQLPKAEDGASRGGDDDDDVFINVIVDGNAITAADARERIQKIVNERSANVNTRLRGIPAEFYPFIAGPQNSLVEELQRKSGAQIKIPPHHVWSPASRLDAPVSGQRPIFQPATDHHIQLAGDRAATQAVRAEIERQSALLQEELMLVQAEIARGRHQFIIGSLGVTPDEFFAETGCVILLPTEDDEEAVTIIGPADRTEAGLNKAEAMAMDVQMANVNHLQWTSKQAPNNAAGHSKNVTRYLRHRQEVSRLEKEHSAHINTPFSQDGALPWELYIPRGKKISPASAEIRGLFEGHPPSRISSVDVDPFFHQYMRNKVHSHVRQNYGVHMVVPSADEPDLPILLVYENAEPSTAQSYEVPRTVPSSSEIAAFQQGLRDAQEHILELLAQQESIISTSIDVPHKFHDKLRRFIKKEQDNRPIDQIPVRVSSLGTTVTLRGPKGAVETMAKNVETFVAQETEDEKERGFTMDFDFPQKHANHLIGKGGSNIKELREKFDVDIQVQDGKVQLKGPKAKAEAARSHIQSLGKQFADETTHTLKIDPSFHRELIGSGGAQINRLQTRYKVLIFFPHSEKGKKDDDDSVSGDANSVATGAKARRQQAADEVVVRGPKKGADEAREEIMTLFQYLKDRSFSSTVTVQQKQLPSLMGRQGTSMEALRRESGAKIDVPNRDEAGETVDIQIRGTKAEVAAAKKLLEEKKAIFDDTVVKTINVDKQYHRALIGREGSNLREMILKAGGSDDRREMSRTIQFPKQEADGDAITIEGKKDVVDKIVAQIKTIVGERESQVSETIDVPVEKHRSLIGRGGDAKRQLESQFKVQINIPRQDSGHTDVKITGQSADVEKCKAHIESLTQETPGETVQVPRSLHHQVADGGKFFRKLKGDHRVTVDHAGQALPARPSAPAPSRTNGGSLPLITDDQDAAADVHSWDVVDSSSSSTEDGDIPWVLRGSPEDIEKAKKAITGALEQAKKSDGAVTGFLNLPDPSLYRHIIGSGGSKINAIRKESGCKITVPRNQGDEPIEVVGSKEGVEKAKELILAAVRDGASGGRRGGEY